LAENKLIARIVGIFPASGFMDIAQILGVIATADVEQELSLITSATSSLGFDIQFQVRTLHATNGRLHSHLSLYRAVATWAMRLVLCF